MFKKLSLLLLAFPGLVFGMDQASGEMQLVAMSPALIEAIRRSDVWRGVLPKPERLLAQSTPIDRAHKMASLLLNQQLLIASLRKDYQNCRVAQALFREMQRDYGDILSVRDDSAISAFVAIVGFNDFAQRIFWERVQQQHLQPDQIIRLCNEARSRTTDRRAQFWLMMRIHEQYSHFDASEQRAKTKQPAKKTKKKSAKKGGAAASSAGPSCAPGVAEDEEWVCATEPLDPRAVSVSVSEKAPVSVKFAFRVLLHVLLLKVLEHQRHPSVPSCLEYWRLMKCIVLKTGP